VISPQYHAAKRFINEIIIPNAKVFLDTVKRERKQKLKTEVSVFLALYYQQIIMIIQNKVYNMINKLVGTYFPFS